MVVPYLSGSAFTYKKPKCLLAVVYSPDDFSGSPMLELLDENPPESSGGLRLWLVRRHTNLQSVLGHHLFGVEFRKNSRYA